MGSIRAPCAYHLARDRYQCKLENLFHKMHARDTIALVAQGNLLIKLFTRGILWSHMAINFKLMMARISSLIIWN